MSESSSVTSIVIDMGQCRGRKKRTLLEIEEAVERAKNQAAERALSEVIRELGTEDKMPKPCPRCARSTPIHTCNVGRALTSLHGEHTLVRNYYFCRVCRLGFYPRDAELGLPADGALTLAMERRVLDFAVNAPYEECADRWRVHYPQTPLSSNQFRQVAERVGTRAEQADRRRL